MKYVARLGAVALGLLCALVVLALVVTASRSADFDGDWLLEELTCEELVSGYTFNIAMLDQIIEQHDNCLAYADSPADRGHGELHCALIRKEGAFVQGLTNDLADVFHAKKCAK